MRTRTSVAASAVLLALSTSLLLAPARAQTGKTWDKTYPVSGHPSVRLEAGSAGMHVTACGGCHTVTIHVDARDQDLGDYTIEETASGNHVSFKLRERNNWSWHTHGQSPEITVQMPAEADVELQTGSGGAELAGVRGNLDIQTGSGGVRIQDAGGHLHARAGSGGVQAEGAFSQFEMHAGSGSTQLTLRPGVQLTGASSMDAGSGGVRLALPHDLKATVHASTGSGGIHSDLPMTTSGNWDSFRHDISGTLNGGGPALDLRTGSGGVQIKGI